MTRIIVSLVLLMALLLPSVAQAANPYYDNTGYPATGAPLQSAAMRAELVLIETGFDKLPTLTANGSKAVVVNSGGTALTVTTGTLTLAGNFATSGSSAITLTSTGTTALTLPTTGTLATLAGAETFTNKTLTSPTISSPVLSGTATGTYTMGGTPTITAPTINSATITGTLTWSPTITGHLLFTDATYDIGASGATRPRDFFLSRNATIGGTLGVTGNVTLSGTSNSVGTITTGTWTGTAVGIAYGGTSLTSLGDDAIVVGDGATSATARTITNCTDTSGQHLNYTQSSNSFSCGTSTSISAATQAEMETATSTTIYVSPGRQQYHPAASKMWVFVTNNGTAAIGASYNVASIVRNATGSVTVNATTAFSSTNIACVVTPNTAASTNRVANVSISTSSQFVVLTFRNTDGVATDDNFGLICYGDQ